MTRQSWIRGKLLGAGAFGSVNLAIQREDGEVFAVKSVVVDANSEVAMRAIENEISLLQALDSEFVVRCLGSDWTEENGQLMRNVFLEYMPEGCLTDFLNQFTRCGVLDEHLIRTYTRSVVEGMEYLHSHNIVHGDIKGKNILVGNGRVKLTDFGSARRLGCNCDANSGDSGSVGCNSHGNSGDFGCAKRVGCDPNANSGGCSKVSGTPLWMAPEVLRLREQGLASDVWSLGCTVVEIATGRAPWRNLEGMNQFVALYHIACTDDLPSIPAWLSPEARDFLSHCFQRDPRKRWTTTQLLQHPFLTTRFMEKASQLDPPSPATVMQFPDDWNTHFSDHLSIPTLAAPPKRKLVSAAPATQVVEHWCPNLWNSPACSGPWIVVRSPLGSPPGSPKTSVAFSTSSTPVSKSFAPLVTPCEESGTSSEESLEQSSVRSSSSGDDVNPDIPMTTGLGFACSELDLDCVGVRLRETSEADCKADGLVAESSISFGLISGEVCISSKYLVVVNRYCNPQILLYWWRCSCERWSRSDWEKTVGNMASNYCMKYTFALILKRAASLAIVCVCECVLSLGMFLYCLMSPWSLIRGSWF